MNVILEVTELTKKFPVIRGIFGEKGKSLIHAVDNINLKIFEGENFGIVGESGCGKSTLVKLIVRLLKPTAGSILFQGVDLLDRSFPQKKLSKNIQFVFQESYASLNPRMSVYDLLREPIDIHSLIKEEEKDRQILALLDLIGLKKHHLTQFPHQLSAGQNQRIAIARALSIEPKILIMDEPVSDLDVSIKAQVLKLLMTLKEVFRGTYIIVSNDLTMIRYICDRLAIMYLGQIIELATTDDLFDLPQHPYTEGLIAAVPIPDPRSREKEKEILRGEVPTPIDPPNHCRFVKRCKYAKEICFQRTPSFLEVTPNHFVSCFYPNKYRGTDKVPFD